MTAIVSFGTFGGFPAFVVTLIAFVIANVVANQPLSIIRKEAQEDLRIAEARLQSLQQRWATEGGTSEFDNKLKSLESVRSQLQELPAQRQRKIQQLEQERRQRQLEKYLDRFKIWDARIEGIGQSRMATLQSYGVETAGDVIESRIMAIPGFGPSLTSRLLAWRYDHEQRFVFNPNLGVDPADVAKVDQEFAAIRAKLEQELRQGPQSLQQITQQICYKRDALRPPVEEALRAVARARMNLAYLK